MTLTFSHRTASRLVVGALVLGGLMAARPAHADVITFFDFNGGTLASTGGARSSTITSNFISTDINAGGTGTTLNADPDGSGPFPASAAGTALRVYNTNPTGLTANQGQYIQFGLNTTGYRALNVSFATGNFLTGFNSNQFQYSLNGTTFTTLSTYTPTTSAYGLQSFDLSNITGLNNNTSATFRIVFSGGSTTSNSARNDFDNISVSGTSTTATPEPETYAMMAIGLVMLGGFSWRRKKNASQSMPALNGMAA